jgi:hypothetical protein
MKEVTIVEESKNEIVTNLDDFIDKTAKDLAENIKPLETESIDLEISFDKIPEEESIKDVEKSVMKELEEVNIVLDIEELEPVEEKKEDPNILKEVDLSSTIENSLETITLKKPNQVYYEIYQKAREKAKEAKKNAIVAYLEMKNIKKTYMLDDIDESDSEFEDFASRDGDSDNESLEDNFE